MSALRAIQFMGVVAIGVLTGLACLNNLMDYNSNFALVQHVLSMDTTFPEGTLRWRAITFPTVHHAAYWLIIATEGLAGVLCLAGAYKMLLARKAGTDIFNQSKNLALWGLGIAFALYLIGFIIRLVPHYWLGAFFVLAHLAAGARAVMMAHGVSKALGDRLMVGGAVLAGLVATVIMLGMCGMRVRFV